MSKAAQAAVDALLAKDYLQYGNTQIPKDWKYVTGPNAELLVYNPSKPREFVVVSNANSGEGQQLMEFLHVHSPTHNASGDLNVVAQANGYSNLYDIFNNVTPSTSSSDVYGTAYNSVAQNSSPSQTSSGSNNTNNNMALSISTSTLQAGSSNVADVKALQSFLNSKGANIAVDGLFGPATTAALKNYQSQNGLIADGILGPATLAKANASTTTTQTPTQIQNPNQTSNVVNYTGTQPISNTIPSSQTPSTQFSLTGGNLQSGSTGQNVKDLQNFLISKGYNGADGPLIADGNFGKNTLKAVRDYQADNGLVVDGIVGANTVSKMNGTAPATPGTSTQNTSAPAKISSADQAYLDSVKQQLINGTFSGNERIEDRLIPSYQAAGINVVDGQINQSNNQSLRSNTTAPDTTQGTITQQNNINQNVANFPLTNGNLQSGAKNDNVKDLQNFLISKGYNVGSTGADGDFGPATKAAVMQFQTDNNLTADGIVGVQTVAKINSYIQNTGTTTNGTTPATNTSPTTTTGNLNLYGQQRYIPGEKFAEQAIYSEADLGGSSSVGELTPSFVSALKNDPNKIAFYLGALAYGGYTMGDIYADMYANNQKQLGKLTTVPTIISPTMNKAAYSQTPEGIAASKTIDTLIPSGSRMKTINPEIFNYSINEIPDNAFSPYANRLPLPGTPEWTAAASQIKATYFDLLSAQAIAETEQEKSLADYNLKQFNDEVQKTLGISLSNNSAQAWKQLQSLVDGYNTRGIQQSGLRNEAVDEMLRATRLADTRNREATLTEIEKQTLDSLRTSGTAAQIAALTPEMRAKLGLTPSAEVANQFSIENIKKMDPTLTDAEAKAYRDTIIDENGNYRSTLYSKYYKTAAQNSEDKKKYQNETLTNNNLIAEDKAARETALSNSQNMFDTTNFTPAGSSIANTSTPSGSNSNSYIPVTNTPASNTTISSAAANAAANAASNLGTNSNQNKQTQNTQPVSTTPASSTTNYDSWISSSNLKTGSKSSGVAGLQSYLGITSDGIFGTQTDSAVRAFQQRNGLSVDGIVGPATIAAIKAGKK